MVFDFNPLCCGGVHFLIFFYIFSLAEETLRDEVEEYVRTRRGKELPGFVNYRTFENIVKKHIEELEEPALKLLKDAAGEWQYFKRWFEVLHAWKKIKTKLVMDIKYAMHIYFVVPYCN